MVSRGGIYIEINFEITEEDYIKFNLYHVKNSKSQRRTFNLLRYAIPLLFSVPIYSIGTNLFKQPKPYWIIIAILFAGVWIITYPNQYKRLIKRETKKLLQEGDNSSLFGKKTMVMDGDDVRVISENSTETILKKSIKTVKIYDDMILVYLSAITAQIIPTRYLNEEIKESLMRELDIY